MLQVQETSLKEARLFFPDVHDDHRGFFKETYSKDKYEKLGLCDTFVQDSVSFSSRNVLRGLHGDYDMSKLVQCLRGRIYDVIVDRNMGSPTENKWEAFVLTESNHKQLYVPSGFAHGFVALTDDVIVSYKQSAPHNPSTEFQIRWDDPAIGIVWPCDPVYLSKKDAEAPLLRCVGDILVAGVS